MKDSQIPADLLYTRDHYWIRIEEGVASVGLTDHAQNELGDVVLVELPEVGLEYHAAEEIGRLESVKATTELYAPISGKAVEVNTRLETAPYLVNREPYGDGWIVRMRLTDVSEVNELLTPDDYGHLVEEGE